MVPRDLSVQVELPFDSFKPWQVLVTLGKQLNILAHLPHKGQQPTAIGIQLGGKACAFA